MAPSASGWRVAILVRGILRSALITGTGAMLEWEEIAALVADRYGLQRGPKP